MTYDLNDHFPHSLRSSLAEVLKTTETIGTIFFPCPAHLAIALTLHFVACQSKKRANSNKNYPCNVRSLRGFFRPHVFAYLCIFAPHFSAILKEPNLRFESAHLTSSKRLFDELIKAL